MWRESKFLILFVVLFAVFLGNIVLGKAQLVFGWDLPFLLGDIAEFLLLLTAAIFFTLAVLKKERSAVDGEVPSDTEAGRR
jgi:heme A synthase